MTTIDREVRQKKNAQVEAALALLLDEGQPVELRVLGSGRGTVSGYFTDHAKLAEAAARWSGRADGIYITPNPVNPALLARANNRVVEHAKHATSDKDITARRWLLLDFDPLRPSGISATDEEHDAAVERARACRQWLIDIVGVPENAIIHCTRSTAATMLRAGGLGDDDCMRIGGWKTRSVFNHYQLGDDEALRERLAAARPRVRGGVAALNSDR